MASFGLLFFKGSLLLCFMAVWRSIGFQKELLMVVKQFEKDGVPSEEWVVVIRMFLKLPRFQRLQNH